MSFHCTYYLSQINPVYSYNKYSRNYLFVAQNLIQQYNISITVNGTVGVCSATMSFPQ